MDTVVGRLNFLLLVPFWGHVNFRGVYHCFLCKPLSIGNRGKFIGHFEPNPNQQNQQITELNSTKATNWTIQQNSTKATHPKLYPNFECFESKKKTSLMNQATRAAKRCPAPKFLGRWLRGTEYLTSDGNVKPTSGIGFSGWLIGMFIPACPNLLLVTMSLYNCAT